MRTLTDRGFTPDCDDDANKSRNVSVAFVAVVTRRS